MSIAKKDKALERFVLNPNNDMMVLILWEGKLSDGNPAA